MEFISASYHCIPLISMLQRYQTSDLSVNFLYVITQSSSTILNSCLYGIGWFNLQTYSCLKSDILINTFALELLLKSAKVIETSNFCGFLDLTLVFFDFYIKKIYNLDKTTQTKMGGTYG